jgi:peptidoglycan/xylan/chitin deacetylase (PgdA/CDA1 family)
MSDRIAWPNGVKCPVVLSFDVDAELLWNVWLAGKPSLIDVSQGAYDLKAGVPRVLSMLKRQGIRGTFFVPGLITERYPEEISNIAKQGHEIAHHGYEHEDCSKLTQQEERRMLEKGSEAIEHVSGKRPRGFRLLPGRNTLKLLAEAGFEYDSVLMDDDQPYVVPAHEGHRALVELPVSFAFNDTSYFAYTFGMSKPLMAPREVERIYIDEFDALQAEEKYCMFMLHPQVIGRASRLAMLERTIQHMKETGGVWFATAEEVAQHCRRALL